MVFSALIGADGRGRSEIPHFFDKFWRVPNPPGANPLVAERAFPTSDYWGRTGVVRCAEEMTGICRDSNRLLTPCHTRLRRPPRGPFSYQGVSTRGVRHSPEIAVICSSTKEKGGRREKRSKTNKNKEKILKNSIHPYLHQPLWELLKGWGLGHAASGCGKLTVKFWDGSWEWFLRESTESTQRILGGRVQEPFDLLIINYFVLPCLGGEAIFTYSWSFFAYC